MFGIQDDYFLYDVVNASFNPSNTEILTEPDPLDEWGPASIQETADIYRAGPVISLQLNPSFSDENNEDSREEYLPFKPPEISYEASNSQAKNIVQMLTTTRHQLISDKISDWFQLLSKFGYI